MPIHIRNVRLVPAAVGASRCRSLAGRRARKARISTGSRSPMCGPRRSESTAATRSVSVEFQRRDRQARDGLPGHMSRPRRTRSGASWTSASWRWATIRVAGPRRTECGPRHDVDGSGAGLESGGGAIHGLRGVRRPAATSTWTSTCEWIQSRRSPPESRTGLDKSFSDFLRRRAIQRTAQRTVAAYLHRRPVWWRYRRHLDTRRLRCLPKRTAPFHCGLQTPRNGGRRRAMPRVVTRAFRARWSATASVSEAPLGTSGKQLKNKQKAGFF